MKETIEIKQNRRDVRGVLAWLTEIEEAILNGYRLDKEDRGTMTGPRILPVLRVHLHKGEEDKIVEVSVPEEINVPPLHESTLALTPHASEVTGEVAEEVEYNILEDVKAKKADLLEWAKEKEIEVPEELKTPAAIRKHLKTVI